VENFKISCIYQQLERTKGGKKFFHKFSHFSVLSDRNKTKFQNWGFNFQPASFDLCSGTIGHLATQVEKTTYATNFLLLDK
jgi:hypothetical protein